MRTTIQNYRLYGLAMLCCVSISAQSPADKQIFWVHEDHVKPSMVDEYEQANMELVNKLKEHEIQDEQWITAQTSDYRYLYVGPLNNMADLDRAMFSTLAEKMGEDKMMSLFSQMDGYYDRHLNYIIHLDQDLSYMPDGFTQTPEGQDFRKFYFLHTTPAKRAKLAESLKAVKDMHQRKGSKVQYRVYQSGFGAPNDFFMVAIAAKDPITYEQNAMANQKLLGPEAKSVFDGVLDNLSKFEVVPGRMRPDMAYSPE